MRRERAMRLSVAMILVLLAGCASEPRDAESCLARLGDAASAESSRRLADGRLVALVGKTDERRVRVLERMLHTAGESDEMQIYAIDQLLEAGPEIAAEVLKGRLEKMYPPVLDRACGVAAATGDMRLVEVMVKSLVRESPGLPRGKRPEVGAIEKLCGAKIGEVLLRIVAESRAAEVRYAALEVAAELVNPADARTFLARQKVRAGDGVMEAVQWSIENFLYVPVNRNEVEWTVAVMRDPEVRLRVVRTHRQMERAEGYVFAPRFLGVMAFDNPRGGGQLVVQAGREFLLEGIKRSLMGEHLARVGSEVSPETPADETLAGNLGKLSHEDLATIAVLLGSLQEEDFCREVMKLGLEDRADTSSEHGGLLRVVGVEEKKDARVWPVVFPPFQVGDDRSYQASDKLFAATIHGVAHFHFHFQLEDNRAIAGPGKGDMEYARRNRVNCVVFTSVGKERFDVDYYTPAGAVVDLGVYSGE